MTIRLMLAQSLPHLTGERGGPLGESGKAKTLAWGKPKVFLRVNVNCQTQNPTNRIGTRLFRALKGVRNASEGTASEFADTVLTSEIRCVTDCDALGS
jgi:hypothetical protein